MEFLKYLSERVPLFRSFRALRYLFAGGSAAAANIITLYVLTEFMHVWYLLSSILALIVGFALSFILQKFWTFRNMPLNRVQVQLPLHILLSLFNLVLNTIFLYALVEWAHTWYILAQLISGAALACMNYFVYKWYIFPDESR